MSLFFDILLACCEGISKEEYLSGSFKSNHSSRENKKSMLKSARSTLWNTLHHKFTIKNITVSNKCKNFYMDNATFEHRKQLFNDYNECFEISNSFLRFKNGPNNELLLNSTVDSSVKRDTNKSIVINSILKGSSLMCNESNLIMNCQISSSEIELGANSVISDVVWVKKKKKLLNKR